MARARLDPAHPPAFAVDQLKDLDALTPEQIEDNARTDRDNPPLTDEELERVRLARAVQAVRKARGMTQAVFAETYGIALARLRDWEQGRFQPDGLAMAYLETIRHEPEAVARALAKARAAA